METVAFEHSTEQLSQILFEVIHLVSDETELSEVYAGIHKQLKKLMPAANCIFIRLPEDKSGFVIDYYADECHQVPLRELQTLPRSRLDRTLTGLMLTQMALCHFRRAEINQMIESRQIEAIGEVPTEWLGVPLMLDDRVAGAMVIQTYRDDEGYNQQQKQVLNVIARQVALALLLFEQRQRLADGERRLKEEVAARTAELKATITALRRNMEERRAMEARLAHQSLHDSLTGLANRQLFANRLQQALRVRERERREVAVIFLDLDHFKNINDALGHDAGDQLLKVVAQRLEAATRPNDTVARFGGDEFAILLTSIRHRNEALQIARRIHTELRQPVILNGREVVPGGSLGVSTTELSEARSEALMRDADAAMYRAKARGKQQVCLFDTSIHQDVSRRLFLENELRRALRQQDELFMVYQPILALSSGQPVGFEALVRWQHPERGVIPPDVFIPVAEASGQILALGHYVLEAVVSQLKVWDDSRFWVSVNVSPIELLHGDFVSHMMRICQRHKVDPRRLHLEVTESVVIENVLSAQACLRILQEQGIRAALDDFGTGYSSLRYLQTLPFDYIKVDKAFVQVLSENNMDPIVETLAFLRQRIDKKLIAEGVETLEQLTILQHLHYDFAQGYLFAKPMGADDVPGFYRNFNFSACSQPPKRQLQ
ncbi:MAG: EAL domain-containing protein [Gammaproteobacteria bacterium]|nr:MAG: EAL domain-containing protein [Gammaproteobacteria bacterium]